MPKLAPSDVERSSAPYSGRVPSKGSPRAAAQGYDVLIVEDDVIIREQLADRLRDEGYSIATASNGREALALLQATPVRLVILDLMLPVMSGWEFLDVVEKDPMLQDVPRLVVTAFSNARRPAGAPVFLKPINTTSLLRAVRTHLGARQ